MTQRLAETPNRKQPPVPGGRPHRVRVQLTTEQLQALQQLSREMDIGIPEILVSSALDNPQKTTRTFANEVAGIRQVVTEENNQLRRIADSLDRNEDVKLLGWDDLRQTLYERNQSLAKLLKW